MKLYGITAERLILARNGTECIDHEGNIFEVYDTAFSDFCFLENNETIYLQKEALAGYSYINRYKGLLSKVLEMIGMTPDYFYLKDIYKFLDANYQANKKQTIPSAEYPHFRECSWFMWKNEPTFTIKALFKRHQISLLEELDKFAALTGIGYKSGKNWLAEDYFQLKALLDAEIPDEF